MPRQRDLVTFHANGKPYSLKYRHKNLKDVVARTGKSITQLFEDPFDGWPHLLAEGLRHQHPRITADDACELIDAWMDDGHELKDIQDKVLDALTETGYLKKSGGDESAEGKATSPSLTQ